MAAGTGQTGTRSGGERYSGPSVPPRFSLGGNGVWLLWAIGIAWLVLLVALPVGYLLYDALTNDSGRLVLSNFYDFATDAKNQEAILNSFALGSAVAIFSVLIGAPLAFGVARTDMKFKGLVQAAMIISLVSPDFLLAMAYVGLAGPNAGYLNALTKAVFGVEQGPFNIFSLWGLIFTALPHGVSFVFLALVPALRNIDPALEEAGRVHGAGVRYVIFVITLPLMRPALLSGALLAFSISLATYGPPQILGINVLTIAIRRSLLELDFKLASVASIMLVAISIVALVLYRHSIRQSERFRTMGGKSFSYRPMNLGSGVFILTLFGIAYALYALIIPYGTILAISLMKSVGEGFSWGNWTFLNYVAMQEAPLVRHAAVTSILLASISATLVALMGFVVAYLLVRTKLPGRGFADYLSMLPLAIPGTALAMALIVVYLSEPFNALGLYGTFGILLIAYLARFVTFGVRLNQSSLLQLSPELDEAARISGAGPIRTTALITAPLMRNTLIYVWILVFILAIPELSASIILKGLDTPTLSTVLLEVWIGNGGPAVASALGISIFAGVGSLLLAASLIGRRSGLALTG